MSITPNWSTLRQLNYRMVVNDLVQDAELIDPDPFMRLYQLTDDCYISVSIDWEGSDSLFACYFYWASSRSFLLRFHRNEKLPSQTGHAKPPTELLIDGSRSTLSEVKGALVETKIRIISFPEQDAITCHYENLTYIFRQTKYDEYLGQSELNQDTLAVKGCFLDKVDFQIIIRTKKDITPLESSCKFDSTSYPIRVC